VTLGLAVYLAVLVVVAAAVLLGVVSLVRTLIGVREEGPPPWWAVLVGAVALLAIPVGAVWAYFLLPAPITERSLANSIERETNQGFTSDCSKEFGQKWRCEMRDASGELVSYSVTAGQRCWYASRDDDVAGTRVVREPESCTTLRDVIEP
jgi:hypothetical protein